MQTSRTQSDAIGKPEQSQVERHPRMPSNPTSRASFHSFPVEIISTVFKCYIDLARSSLKPHPSLLLGKICQQWRQIAWSTPQLWAELTIPHRHAMSDTHVALAKEWLARSGVLPLAIEFSNYCDDGDCHWNEVMSRSSRMLDALGRCSDRWRSVTLVGPSASLRGLTLRPLSPLLHYLSLDGRWNEDHLDFDIFTQELPRISTFKNCAPTIVKITSLDVDINWTAVTDMTLESVDVDKALQVLPLAPKLLKCSLLDIRDDSDTSTLVAGGLVTSTTLESLIVSFDDEDSPSIFFKSTSLPALKHLSLDSPVSTEDLILFLTRSSSALTSLTIQETNFEGGSILTLAPLLSSLTELRIFNSGYGNRTVNDTFYQLLADPSQLPPHTALPSSPTLPYLPYLETFAWEGHLPYPWETLPGLFAPVVQNATPYRRPLKCVKIDCIAYPTSYIPKNVVKELLQFSDVKFEFTFSRNVEQDTDLWKASLQRYRED